MSSSFIPLAGTSLPDLKSSTLIIPSVSIGNIPQLTIDLLIHTLDFEKIGSLSDTYLYPFASPIDHTVDKPQTGISNAIEIYYNSKNHVTVIQQRSPIIPSFIGAYVNEIINPFITKCQFAKVFVLDSSDAGLVEEISPGTIDVYTQEDFLSKSLESLKLSKKQITSYDHSVYGRALIKAITDDSSAAPELNVLVTYVYEGDNFYDGEVLANKLVKVMELEQVDKWIKPVSWLGVYGDKPLPNGMEDGLFG